MKHITYYIVLMLAVLASCRPDPIPLELEPHQPKLVVSSQVVPDQVMLIVLTRSFSVLDEGQGQDSIGQSLLDSILVENADVTISYRDIVDTLFMIQPGVYASISTPQYTNEVYTLNCVDNEKNKECSAVAVMLEQVAFDTVSVTPSTPEDSSLNVSFEFTDIVGENYYMINVYRRGENNGAVDNSTIFENGSNVLLGTELISDANYSSSQIGYDFDVYGISESDTIAISLSHIDEQYYEYLLLRKKSENWFSQITQEPINYPTNVNNGYGFFNTHFPDVRIFDLNEE